MFYFILYFIIQLNKKNDVTSELNGLKKIQFPYVMCWKKYNSGLDDLGSGLDDLGGNDSLHPK